MYFTKNTWKFINYIYSYKFIRFKGLNKFKKDKATFIPEIISTNTRMFIHVGNRLIYLNSNLYCFRLYWLKYLKK